MTTPKLISREEVLSGMTGRSSKQASALLVLIENRTAYLAALSQQAMDEFLTEEAAQAHTKVFLDALALGRAAPISPPIQALEHYAPQWATLVAENPNIRAIVAHLLSQKYQFTAPATPNLRAALGLDMPAVQAAYQRLYNQPLATIFTAQTTTAEQLRWTWTSIGAWLENLPPFWTAFALTLTSTVGSSVLALPIALAGVGPLAGVALLVVLGLVNVLTIAFMAETFTRTASIRYGKSFIGRVVTGYLGHAGAVILSLGTFLYCVLSLFAYYIGFSTTMAAATHLPAMVWVLLLFVVGLYYVRRESLSATVASALVIGAINIGLILLLSLLALRRAQPANLLYINLPWLNGRPFDRGILRLTLGVVLGVYASHLSVSNCARVVLQRDASGRSLMRGATAALLTAIVLFCIWVVAVNGAIPPALLAQETGTALVPLAKQVGPLVHIIGAIYVFLGIGMISIHSSLGLFNLTREWLPRPQLGALRLNKQVHTLLLLTPMFFVFGMTEWLLFTGIGSFTQINSLRGALVAPLLTGIFPVLLIVASRAKGEIVPGVVYRWLGKRWLVTSIYLLFMASIFIHGLVIWTDPLQRTIALITGVLLLGVTLWIVWRGAFQWRVVVELRKNENSGGQSAFAVVAGGQPMPTAVQLTYRTGVQQLQAASAEIQRFPALQAVSFHLLTAGAKELKVWAHQVTSAGESVGLNCALSVLDGPTSKAITLPPTSGQVLLPLTSESCQVEIKVNSEAF
ncbi:MAG: hypothetical protein U0350_20275 [Caldilineaceae bacterium]